MFFSDEDYDADRHLLATAAWQARVGVWAWRLMPAMSSARATRTGCGAPWRACIAPMPGASLRAGGAPVASGRGVSGRSRWPPHCVAAWRCVALNPVRARLVERAEEWRWSSARALLGLEDDSLTGVAPARARLERFAGLLEADEDAAATGRLRKGERVGRPIVSEDFLATLEARTSRRLRPGAGQSGDD